MMRCTGRKMKIFQENKNTTTILKVMPYCDIIVDLLMEEA